MTSRTIVEPEDYVAPVGEGQTFIAGILDVIDRHLVADPALTALA